MCVCVCVWSCITCKCADECRMGLLSGLKKVFSVPHSGFSSVPKHNVMEHDSSLVPWWPLTPITVVWDPTLSYPTPTDLHTHTHTHTDTHTSAHCFNRLEEIAGKLCQTCSLCARQKELETTREKSSHFLSARLSLSLSHSSFLTDKKLSTGKKNWWSILKVWP